MEYGIWFMEYGIWNAAASCNRQRMNRMTGEVHRPTI